MKAVRHGTEKNKSSRQAWLGTRGPWGKETLVVCKSRGKGGRQSLDMAAHLHQKGAKTSQVEGTKLRAGSSNSIAFNP